MKKIFLLLLFQTYFSFGQQEIYAIDTTFHFKPKTVSSKLFNKAFAYETRYLGSYQSNHIITSIQDSYSQDLYLIDTMGNVLMSHLNESTKVRQSTYILPDGYKTESGFWFMKYYEEINETSFENENIVSLFFFDNKTKKVIEHLSLKNQYNQLPSVAIRGNNFYLIRSDRQKFWIYDLTTKQIVKEFELYPQLFSNSTASNFFYNILDVHRSGSSEFTMLCAVNEEDKEKIQLFKCKNTETPRPINKIYEFGATSNYYNVRKFIDNENILISNQDSAYSANCLLLNYKTLVISNQARVQKISEDKVLFLDNEWIVFSQNRYLETPAYFDSSNQNKTAIKGLGINYYNGLTMDSVEVYGANKRPQKLAVISPITKQTLTFSKIIPLNNGDYWAVANSNTQSYLIKYRGSQELFSYELNFEDRYNISYHHLPNNGLLVGSNWYIIISEDNKVVLIDKQLLRPNSVYYSDTTRGHLYVYEGGFKRLKSSFEVDDTFKKIVGKDQLVVNNSGTIFTGNRTRQAGVYDNFTIFDNSGNFQKEFSRKQLVDLLKLSGGSSMGSYQGNVLPVAFTNEFLLLGVESCSEGCYVSTLIPVNFDLTQVFNIQESSKPNQSLANRMYYGAIQFNEMIDNNLSFLKLNKTTNTLEIDENRVVRFRRNNISSFNITAEKDILIPSGNLITRLSTKNSVWVKFISPNTENLENETYQIQKSFPSQKITIPIETFSSDKSDVILSLFQTKDVSAYLNGTNLIVEKTGSIKILLQSVKGGQTQVLKINVYAESESTESEPTIEILQINTIFPNPVASGGRITVRTIGYFYDKIYLVDSKGNKIELAVSIASSLPEMGLFDFVIDLPVMPSGIYFIEACSEVSKKKAVKRIFIN